MRINAGLRVPLTVIGGFLGAGKTTLVNALLAEPGGARLAVLVNDFGAVNIDASLVASRAADTIALSNGCVCCAMGDDLGRGIATILARRPAPEHIVVEASGVADPWRIAEIALIDPDLILAGVVVLADVSTITGLMTDPLVGEAARRQVRVADLLFLTKPDHASAERFEAARAALSELAPGARQLTVSHGAVPAEVVLGEAGTDRRIGPSRPARHTSLFVSVTLQPSRPVADADLRAALDRLPAPVLRAKGLLRAPGEADQAWLVQRVGQRTEITRHPLPADAAEALVLIGTAGTAAAAETLRPLGLMPARALPDLR